MEGWLVKWREWIVRFWGGWLDGEWMVRWRVIWKGGWFNGGGWLNGGNGWLNGRVDG